MRPDVLRDQHPVPETVEVVGRSVNTHGVPPRAGSGERPVVSDSLRTRVRGLPGPSPPPAVQSGPAEVASDLPVRQDGGSRQ